jgi:hypothetical protein
MSRVCVLQTDNRLNLDYLLLTQEVNKRFCQYYNYEYLFIENIENKYGNIDLANNKIYIINDILHIDKYDIIIFMDSDAWIQNSEYLVELLSYLINNPDKQGCFSREPYLMYGTFINSGSFILKVNDYTRNMYKNIIANFENKNVPNHFLINPNDQKFISPYVFENKDDFIILIPEGLNTPEGIILRHNWWKNQKMYDDLYIKLNRIQVNNDLLDIEKYLDKEPFPVMSNYGNEYR